MIEALTGDQFYKDNFRRIDQDFEALRAPASQTGKIMTTMGGNPFYAAPPVRDMMHLGMATLEMRAKHAALEITPDATRQRILLRAFDTHIGTLYGKIPWGDNGEPLLTVPENLVDSFRDIQRLLMFADARIEKNGPQNELLLNLARLLFDNLNDMRLDLRVPRVDADVMAHSLEMYMRRERREKDSPRIGPPGHRIITEEEAEQLRNS